MSRIERKFSFLRRKRKREDKEEKRKFMRGSIKAILGVKVVVFVIVVALKIMAFAFLKCCGFREESASISEIQYIVTSRCESHAFVLVVIVSL